MPLASRDGNDETEGPEIQGSHAALLDRIFAWEKKLYNEVKGFEIIRLQYERKSAELRKLESKGIEVGLDEMKATIKFLRLRTMVALQAVDTASTAIARLRDDELYLQLLHLLHVTMNMWHEMYHNHQEQTSILSEMVKLDDLLRAVDQTCNLHMLSTQQLEGVLNEWHKTFKEFIPSQRIYMQNLNGWLRLNLVPLQTASGEKLDHQLTDSPTPPIYKLCQEWHQALEKLPDQIVLEAINSVVEMVHDLVELHLEELHRKKVVQALERQLDKKVTALENYKRKYFEPTDVAEERQDLVDDPLQERKNVIDELRKRVDDEKAKISKAVQDSRKVTKQVFSSGLPGLFEAFTHFSSICLQMYQGLDKPVTTAGSPSSTDTT
ncbi:hypothetical protein O6H91_14G016000 [Diphasiastrum complanatum]|nr:hypothetical protein O6H91_14G016000 [Diphasiastrum complanatum]